MDTWKAFDILGEFEVFRLALTRGLVTKDKKYIKIASEDGNNYIVSSGLNDGDVLILDNFKKIRQGAKVQIIEQKALNDQNDSKNAK